MRLHFVTNLIVAFVEFMLVALLSLAFWSNFRYGNQYAQYMLGKMHLMGQGVDYDKELGNYWLRQSADQGNVYADALLRRENEHLPPNVFLGINRLLHHMSRIFQNNSLPQSHPGGIQIDRKRMQALQEKRAALGQKGNVYEQYKGWSMSM